MALERHLEQHDYVLGVAPRSRTSACLGNLCSLCRDPVAGFDLRTRFPSRLRVGRADQCGELPSMLGDMVKSYTKSMTPVH